jgi:hypothetical protein
MARWVVFWDYKGMFSYRSQENIRPRVSLYGTLGVSCVRRLARVARQYCLWRNLLGEGCDENGDQVEAGCGAMTVRWR